LGLNTYKPGSATEANIISTVVQNFGDRPVDIMKILSIFVKTNLSHGSSYFDNDKTLTASNYIHRFFPKVGPGLKINKELSNLIWYPLNLHEVDVANFYCVDQDGNAILNGPDENNRESLTIDFEIRET
jgi:hypothetical protein